METSTPEPISDQESLRRLRDFLRQLEKLLTELTERPGPLIPGRHHESMRAAWAAVQPKFSVLVGQHLRSKTNVPKLKDAGLIGTELVFKLSVFQHAHDELLDALTHKDAAPEGWLKRNWRALGKLFKRALKAGDVILGSLAKALPLSPAEVIKEFKEGAESGIDLGLAAGDVTNPQESGGSED